MNEKQMSIEYVIWGIPGKPHDQTYEQVLNTNAKTYKEAEKICKILEKEHDCKNCRIQILDLLVAPDFTKTLNF